ncbi:MAG: TRAP transporter substrate-binding protein [Gammaproteobacteria bacterium]|nr:TRAP transporter substrate-binding protein [Gammaproteobacteria bacterium]
MIKRMLVTAVSSALISVCTSAAADTSAKLDVASAYSLRNIFGKGIENVARELDTISDGELKLKAYEPGEIVPPFEILNAVSSGSVAAGWSSISYFSGTLPIAKLYGALPFSPPANVVFSWTTAGEGRNLLQKSLDKYNVKVVPCSYLPQEPGGWFNKEINTVEDFKGLSMRISGLGAKVLNKFGASTQLVPGNEVYLALERGRVDAAEFSIPEVDSAVGLNEIAKNYYFPGWQQGAGWLALLINKAQWEKLGPTQQERIETVCRSNIQTDFDVVIPNQMRALEKLQSSGVSIKRFPEPVLSALREGWNEVLQEEMKTNPEFKEAYTSLIDHENLVKNWYEMQYIGQ